MTTFGKRLLSDETKVNGVRPLPKQRPDPDGYSPRGTRGARGKAIEQEPCGL